MQTIGKTADEMEFPSTWTDILLKSISSKANSYTIDVKIGAKRVAAAEQDVPKKRRKQPNPTRISADEKCGVGVGGDVGAETANGEEPPQPSSSPLNLTARPLKSAKNDPVGHRPDAVSQNRPPRVSDGCSPAAASSSPDDGPFGNRPATTVGLGAAAVQIFNPEAFCELCNKEFCNKYFLKTHKANKHGVFADGGPLLQHDPPPPPPDKTHQQLSTASRGGEHTASGNGGGTSFKNLAPPPFGRPQVHAQTAAKGAHHNNNNNNNNQTRAFCDVCHKEFCNKYFVRRHKAKIHGMTDDCGDQCGRPTAWGGDDQPAVPSFPIKNETVLDFAVANRATGCCPTVLLLSDGTPRSPGKPSEDGGTARSVIVEAPCRHAVKVERPSADEEDEYEEEVDDGTADRSFASHDEPRDGYAHEPAEYDESQLLWNNEFADVESSAWRRLTTEEPGVRENRGRSGVANVAVGTGVIVKNACRNDDGSRDSLSPSPPRGSVKSGGERRAEPGDSSAAAPSSSFCKICNKELCNKYFMRTHMQRMHGISVRNGDHIGGVVCDVCNKELCSKYFLRVHKQNSHGIVSENGGGGGVLHQRYWPDAAAENGQLSSADEPPADSAAGQLLHRYYRHYAEACNVCFRRFKSPKWLSAHLLNDHGDEGRAQWNHVQNHMLQQQQADETAAAGLQSAEDQQQPPPPPPPLQQQMKQYRCSYCPFATSVLSFLFVHEKFHSAENGRGEHATADAFPAHACGACFVAFPDRARWQEHVTRCRAAREPFAAAADGGSPASDACRQYLTNEDSGSAADKSPPDANGDDAAQAVAEPPANQEPFIMQSFFLENCSVSPQSVDRSESCGDGGGGRSDSFHSSLVYLPVKEKLTSTVNVFFKLTPT